MFAADVSDKQHIGINQIWVSIAARLMGLCAFVGLGDVTPCPRPLTQLPRRQGVTAPFMDDVQFRTYL
jgi:hypothetical protein